MAWLITDKLDRTLRNPAVLGALAALPAVGLFVLALICWPWIKPVLSSQFGFAVLMMLLILFLIIHGCAACILAERKISAYIQDRVGPNRVGFLGVLQPVADGIKFIFKEDIIPGNVDRPIYILAPCLAFIIALIGFAVIPWAGDITWPWKDAAGNPITVSTQVASLDIGILYILAVGALSVYGVVLAGWASNNKYAMYGGMRATAQMLSYEVPLGLGVLCIILVSGTLRLETMVDQQATSGVWNVFLQPVAFVLVLIAAFAETNRAPFDLAEAEQELVAGYHTEYSSMKFALFYLGEYAHMLTNSALMVAIFFGGGEPIPFIGLLANNDTWWAALIKFHVFWGKIALFIVLYMVIRWTLPRFRFDQLMRLAWKSMVPVGMALVVLTGVLVTMQLQRSIIASLVINAAVVAVTLYVAAQARAPVTGRQENLPDVEVAPQRRRMATAGVE